MRTMSKALVGLLAWALVSPALAGITVTSYQTVAQVNGYAPVSQTQYFEQQTLTNVSPAMAQVSGDWMGPNAGGKTPTWHYVGSAQAMSTTAFDANSLTITAAGSFAYTVDTTADFVDPGGVTIYRPGAAAEYNGFFNTDEPVTYAITAQLNQWGRVRLNSLDGSVVFDQSNHTMIPMTVSLSGTIPPRQYRVLFTTGLGAPNLPNGANHFEASGSYEDVVFSVQVPEANSFVLAISIIGAILRRRRRCARAG